MTQAELAAAAGLQASAISHFETGRRAPSFDNLRAIADALSMTTDFLLGRKASSPAVAPAAHKLARRISRLSPKDQQTLAAVAKVLGKQRRAKP